MIALKIPDVRDFMKHLLMENTFDRFLMNEAEVFTGVILTIDGHLREGFYTEDEYQALHSEGEFIPYQMMRPILFDAIKGTHTPTQMKVTLVASREMVRNYLPNPDTDTSFYVILRYQDGAVTAISGVSMKTFTMDKSEEEAWDAVLPKLFDSMEIAADPL